MGYEKPDSLCATRSAPTPDVTGDLGIDAKGHPTASPPENGPIPWSPLATPRTRTVLHRAGCQSASEDPEYLVARRSARAAFRLTTGPSSRTQSPPSLPISVRCPMYQYAIREAPQVMQMRLGHHRQLVASSAANRRQRLCEIRSRGSPDPKADTRSRCAWLGSTSAPTAGDSDLGVGRRSDRSGARPRRCHHPPE